MAGDDMMGEPIAEVQSAEPIAFFVMPVFWASPWNFAHGDVISSPCPLLRPLVTVMSALLEPPLTAAVTYTAWLVATGAV